MKLLACLAGFVLLGCVSQSKYDDLKQRYDAAQEQLGQRQQRIGTLGASLQDTRAELAQRKRDNAQAQSELEAIERERQQLVAEQKRLSEQLVAASQDRERLKQSTRLLQEALQQVGKRRAEAERRANELRSLLTRFKSLIDAGTLKIAMADGRMVLQLSTDVLFESGSAKLSKQGKATIEEVTNVLKEVPERRYQVEGHTDNVPIHNPRYASNWELAAARGLGVVQAMISGGVDPHAVSAASYGEFHPVAPNDTDAGRAENRRIEIILVPDLALLPGYEELQEILQGS